uniref:Uncharacterized protein n=1 Tax=Parascaris equorum TaxID=6256 RepID=A0A914R964_PAREQ
MQCDVRWLKDHPNRFICLSPDYFALFQVEEDFKTKLLADFPALKNALELPCEVARPVVHLDFNPTSQLHLAACFDG